MNNKGGLAYSVEEVARMLTDAFNNEKKGILEVEEDYQLGFDYTLNISFDGVKNEYVDFFEEEDVLKILKSGKGYIIGFHTTEQWDSGYDKYEAGSDRIEHTHYEGDTYSLIADMMKKYRRENKKKNS